MNFGLLGLLEVLEGGEPIAVGRGKESALLAILLLHANEPVSTDRLTHGLWGERAPENAAKNVQQYVSRLRRVLGPDRLETTPGGYALHLQPGELDSERFEQLAGDGRAALELGNAASAERLFTTALDLWRGPALADFRYDEFAQEAVRRLESERREATADRVDARLALGQEVRVRPELEQLIDEEPLWERPRGQLMLALYRTGRQSEALDLYRDSRALLDRELGLEPSPELQDLERGILNQDPALGSRRRRTLGVRRRHVVLLAAAGCVVAVAAVVAAVLAFTGGSSQNLGANEVAAIDASAGDPVSYTSVGTTPGDIAVGEGGVWVLNSDDRTITRLDPSTHGVVKTFATTGEPTELAAGAGALWVGSGFPDRGLIETVTSTGEVSRVDPATTAVLTTTRLYGSQEGGASPFPGLGVSLLAVGPGAVWAVDPDGSITRIDAASGARVAHVHATGASAIAVGDAGVWFLTTGSDGTPEVAQVDPRTNRVAQVVRVQTTELVGIAVGDGSVWATDPSEGVVWRIDPGPRPVERTIQLGFGVTQIAFGDGAVWASNLASGTVSRIDPRTDQVTRSEQLAGTPQGLGVGDGRAWVSVVGGTRSGDLPAADCSPVESGGAKPDVLIASDLPLQGPSVAATLAASVRFVLRSHGFRAGRYTVGYQSCDDSTARDQSYDFFKCAANARDYARDAKLVAVLGPYDSGCAAIEIPIENRGPSGPLAMVSPSNTFSAFTRVDPDGPAHAPAIYYPTGTRNYLRLAPPDELQGAAQAVFAKQLGLHRVFLLSDGQEYGDALALGFREAAAHLGVRVVGRATWAPGAPVQKVVAAVAGARAEGVLVAGFNWDGITAIRALRRRFGRHLVMIAGDGYLDIPSTLKAVGPAAEGMYVSLFGLGTPNTPAGRRLLAAFESTQQVQTPLVGTSLPEMLEAAEIVVDAIAGSDGTRASVLHALESTHVTGSILGSFRFDHGDMTPAPFAIFRITGGRGERALPPDYRGSVVARTVRASVGLLRGR
ncbi:MAG TPA: BTAD domain-containing putative transcriptional regulator [Gaiellaceae bacterium]|nr:BTAD domain-containing putative transcriptional regulator [Gaiellaceae bacterium]